MAGRSAGAIALARAASVRAKGDVSQARQDCLEAAALARVSGDHELFAAAALQYGLGAGGLHRSVRFDLQQISLLEEALAALPVGDSSLRVRLFARLAEELVFSAEAAARRTVVGEAVAMAIRLDDPEVLLAARYAQELVRVGPDRSPRERLSSVTSLVELADSLGTSETGYGAHLLRENTLIELGLLDEAREELAVAERLGDELAIPALHAWVLTARARQLFLSGDLAGADELNGAAMTEMLSGRVDPELAQLVVGGQALWLRFGRDGAAAWLPMLEQLWEHNRHLDVLRCFLAYTRAEAGDLSGASGLLAELRGPGLAEIPRTNGWGSALWATARAAAYTRDVTVAAQVHSMVRPLAGRWFAEWASTGHGPVDTTLGVTAATMGELDIAAAHLEEAAAMADAAGSRLWAADARGWGARVLRRRGAPGDDTAARLLLEETLRTCEEIGLPDLASRAAHDLP